MELDIKTELKTINREIITAQEDLFICFDKIEEIESTFKIIMAIQIVQSLIIILLSAFVLWGVL